MRQTASISGCLSRLLWWAFSVPVFFKIMGIGLVVAAVFGAVTLIQIRSSVSQMLYELLEERTRAIARSLAASLERPISTGDLLLVRQKLERTRQLCPDVRYIIVRDARGRVVCHTFERGVPADLLRLEGWPADREVALRVLASSEGLIFNIFCSLLGGDAGGVQLGMKDEMIHREMAMLTRSVLWSLLLCAAVGTGLALFLTRILTYPIDHLVQAANRIGLGDFETRSEVYWADEIGRLAAAFNQMTEGLQRYRQEVAEKERARLVLLEAIVHAQEEERKSIARELHDQLGQSLLALLLSMESLRREGLAQEDRCREMEGRVRQLIEEVRRLAWGMRPSILDDYGLELALARYTEETSRHFGLAIDYQYTCSPGLGRLPPRVEVTLYRIAQQALMNVVRHAQATRASVVVLQGRDEVMLLVEDNGRGFDLSSVQRDGEGCLGLSGMQERAALAGGACAVDSLPGQGTTVRVRIPLGEAQPCQSAS